VASDDNRLPHDSSAAETFGLLVALLVALSPCQVFASVEARMYSLGTFLAAASSWLLLRALREPEYPKHWWAYGFTVAALPYAHHYGLFTAAAQYVFLALYVLHLAVSGRPHLAVLVRNRTLAVVLVAAMAYIPGLNILRFQTGRVQQDYWVRPLSWEIFFGTFSEFLVPKPDYKQLAYGWIPCVVFVTCCLAVAHRARRGDLFAIALVVVPMALSAAASVITPVWVGRYFRFTQLFVLAIVVLATWRVFCRSKALRAGLFGALGLGMIVANVAFWKGLDLEHGHGPRAAVASIMARRAPGEPIVVLDAIQYFPAKFYVKNRAPVRMLEPPFNMFWGWHLIRPNDLITPDKIDAQLKTGVWIISDLPRPAITPGLAALAPLHEEMFTYYNHLHARVYVHHFRVGENNRL
jgi:hypothetical protein